MITWTEKQWVHSKLETLYVFSENLPQNLEKSLKSIRYHVMIVIAFLYFILEFRFLLSLGANYNYVELALI